MIPTSVFDNTVFNFFVKLKTIDLNIIVKSIIKNHVYIPMEVLNEMEKLAINYPEYQSKIFFLADQIKSNFYYKSCSTYDLVVFDLLKSHIDKGEAEAVAQSQKKDIKLFITDDLKCLPFIKKNYPSLKTYSTFFLICIAEVSGLIPDYFNVFKEYHKILIYNKFSDKKRKEHQIRIRYEYEEALKHFGFPLNKREISRKTSVEKILFKS